MPGYDIAIIGAGVMGAAAACKMARDGARVALIDQGSAPNPRAASVDHSKVFRLAYPDPFYAGMASDALKLWEEAERETETELMTRTGLLMIGSRNAQPGYQDSLDSYNALRSIGLEAEMMTGDEAARLFPQFSADAIAYGVLDPSGAILHAERAVAALINLARRRGAGVIENLRVTEIMNRGSVIHLTALGGEVIECDRAMVASGPWTRNLLPEINDLLVTTRQEVFYFEPDTAQGYGVGEFPIFFATDTGFYGFPIHHEGAMKIANHDKGIPVDPDKVTESVSPEAISECRAFFADFIPGLADARLKETRVCMYNNTPDDDFIIDWHPELEGVLIVTGFSGHGFKFGPLIGRIGAELLLRGNTSYSTDRFRLSRFEHR
ncbi:MAG TPA: N-methyl-L-tryptophan oxidase [Blastocatellia bacterium]|nr:N-methyl-L-tryptophan oxidase [Blastocatellia bacterium]